MMLAMRFCVRAAESAESGTAFVRHLACENAEQRIAE